MRTPENTINYYYSLPGVRLLGLCNKKNDLFAIGFLSCVFFLLICVAVYLPTSFRLLDAFFVGLFRARDKFPVTALFTWAIHEQQNWTRARAEHCKHTARFRLN